MKQSHAAAAILQGTKKGKNKTKITPNILAKLVCNQWSQVPTVVCEGGDEQTQSANRAKR